MKFSTQILLLIISLFSYSFHAQDITQKDTISGTELTLTMDRNIKKLLENGEESCSRIAMANAHRNTSVSSSSAASAPSGKVVIPNRPLSDADICRQNPRILGYKIQLTVVKSNEEAQKVKAYFRNRFPTIKAETDASLRPNYKILAGSYFSKASAAADLARIRKYFQSAIATPYRVFCVEAK